MRRALILQWENKGKSVRLSFEYNEKTGFFEVKYNDNSVCFVTDVDGFEEMCSEIKTLRKSEKLREGK